MMALPARGHKILFSAGEGSNGQIAAKPADRRRLAKRNKGVFT